jgi:hypothetical protein
MSNVLSCRSVEGLVGNVDSSLGDRETGLALFLDESCFHVGIAARPWETSSVETKWIQKHECPRDEVHAVSSAT